MTIHEESWSVWRGPECEGDEQGKQRLFVHAMPFSMHWSDRLKVIRDAMHEHDISEVYFCREHIEHHGNEVPIGVAQFEKTERIFVCLDPSWPSFIAYELSHCRKVQLNIILEFDARGIMGPLAGFQKQIKVIWDDFNVSCTDVSRMPHASAYTYHDDVCVLQDPDGRGQLRRFRDGKPID